MLTSLTNALPLGQIGSHRRLTQYSTNLKPPSHSLPKTITHCSSPFPAPCRGFGEGRRIKTLPRMASLCPAPWGPDPSRTNTSD